MKTQPEPNEDDLRFVQASIEIARRARNNGNHPFGALLVNQQGEIILEAENSVITEKDVTGHAETNLIRLASKSYSPDFLATCTLYTSTEPCPMCTCAIFWGNVRRVVYGLSSKNLYHIIGSDHEDVISVACREIFAKGQKEIEVIGPLLEEEARQVHEGFW
jgi:tRNA(Arg) A34 adenosine deaminase TadA